VTCPGYQAKDPAESLVGELVVVDLATARETGRLTLEPGTDLAGCTRDGRTLALLQGLPRSSKYPFPQSKVTFVDTAGPAVNGTLDAAGWDFVKRNTDRLYLFDHGRPDKNPAKNRNAGVDVVSLAVERVDHVDIGRFSRVIFTEGGLMAVLSDGPKGGAAGELRFLREGKLTATLPVAPRPGYIAERAGVVYVVGAGAVTLGDPASLQVIATIPLARGTERIVRDEDRPTELAVTADGRRAFIHYPATEKVAVLDLEQKKAVGSTTTGRGGKKFLNGMMASMAYVMTAGLTAGTWDGINFHNPGDPPQMQVRPDGRFAYALNSNTNDVTVVDADTAAAVGKIGAGGREVLLLGGPTVVVVGQELNFIDATRNVKLDPLSLPGLRGLAPSPDGAFAVALAEHTVLILDGATGKERARLTDFVNPTRIVFAPTAAASPAP